MEKRTTSSGYMPRHPAGKIQEWGKMSAQQKKAWLKNDKSVAKPKKDNRVSFTKQLEDHKAEGASFDNGTWKPKYKGQSFIQALEEHKSKRQFD